MSTNRFLRIWEPALLALIAMINVSCASVKFLTEEEYQFNKIDPTKGIIVGTVFEKAVFTPQGAYFYIETPDRKQIVLSSGAENGRYTIVNKPPTLPKGVGKHFALQLSPGKYLIKRWALDYGSRRSHSNSPETPIEFQVEAGSVIYLGRFSANRYTEVASIDDNHAEDIQYIAKTESLNGIPIHNRAIVYKGWQLPNAASKDVLKMMKP